MWIELGDSTLLNVEEFSSFRLYAVEEGESIIYGGSKTGDYPLVLCSTTDMEQAASQFEKLRNAVMICKETRQAFQELLLGSSV